MRAPVRGPFDDAPLSGLALAVPALSVMAGSLVTIWPYIASFPILPPFGLLFLLGWRMRRSDVFPIWAALPLGLFDDLLSGQSLGTAMLLWTVCFFMIDLLEQRLFYRDFWQDWLIASGGIGFYLITARLVCSPVSSHVDTVLLLQTMVSILLFPLVTRVCVWLDGKRGSA